MVVCKHVSPRPSWACLPVVPAWAVSCILFTLLPDLLTPMLHHGQEKEAKDIDIPNISRSVFEAMMK